MDLRDSLPFHFFLPCLLRLEGQREHISPTVLPSLFCLFLPSLEAVFLPLKPRPDRTCRSREKELRKGRRERETKRLTRKGPERPCTLPPQQPASEQKEEKEAHMYTRGDEGGGMESGYRRLNEGGRGGECVKELRQPEIESIDVLITLIHPSIDPF